jgi:WD40 repeat protein
MYCIAYSPGGDQIATGDGFRIQLWCTETGECIDTLSRGDWPSAIAYSPHGNQLVCTNSGNHLPHKVQIFDVESGTVVHTLTGDELDARGAVYSPNGSHIITYTAQSTVRIWDAEKGVCNHLLTAHSDTINNVAFSPQGDQFATASNDSTVRVWDVATGECRHILVGHKDKVSFAAYSPREEQIASGSSNGLLRVWDLGARTCHWILTGHTEWISRIEYSSRGDRIVSASYDKSVRLWDVMSGQCRAVIQGFQDRVNYISWIEGPSVTYFATGCEDGVVGMWKVETNDDRCDVSLHWATMRGELNVQNTNIQDVQGLSQLNKHLLAQCGAVGEPIHRLRLREAGKKLTTMASVVSKLGTPLDRTEGSALTTSVLLKQLEQWSEQEKGTLCHDVVASIVKIIHGQQ